MIGHWWWTFLWIFAIACSLLLLLVVGWPVLREAGKDWWLRKHVGKPGRRLEP